MKVFFLFITAISLYACSGNNTLKKGGTVNLYVAGCDSIFYCSDSVFNPNNLLSARKNDSAFLKKITDKALSLKKVILFKPLGGSCGGVGETIMNLNTFFTEKGLMFKITATDSSEDKYFNDVSFIEVAKQMMVLNEPSHMYLPKKDTNDMVVHLKLKPEASVTFLLSGNNRIYYYLGSFKGIITETDYVNVRSLIKELSKKINKRDLMFIIKSDPGSTFKNAIDILDEMTINNVPPGHYAEIDITEAEINSINILKKTKNG